MSSLKSGIDVVEFLNTVSECHGDVWFCTDEGDQINLKSELSRYLFAVIAGNKKIMSSGQLRLDEEQDAPLLSRFMA